MSTARVDLTQLSLPIPKQLRCGVKVTVVILATQFGGESVGLGVRYQIEGFSAGVFVVKCLPFPGRDLISYTGTFSHSSK